MRILLLTWSHLLPSKRIHSEIMDTKTNEEPFPTPRESEQDNSTPAAGAVAEQVPATESAPVAGNKGAVLPPNSAALVIIETDSAHAYYGLRWRNRKLPFDAVRGVICVFPDFSDFHYGSAARAVLELWRKEDFCGISFGFVFALIERTGKERHYTILDCGGRTK